MAKDYYDILGVSRSATESEIKLAFRKLAHEHHPDKKGGNETKFKEINEAYQILGNKEKKQQYDRFGSASDGRTGQPFGGFNWQDMGQSSGSPFGGFEDFSQTQQFDFGDIGDILGTMFNAGGGTSQGRSARKGSDIETVVDISFEESYFGIEKDLSLHILVKCENCKGTGNDPDAKITTCKKCGGSGRVSAVRNTMLGAFRTETICPDCDGTGNKSSKKCSDCHGATRVKKIEIIKVKIPAGIDESKSIRLSGRGEAGPRGGQNGDLYLRVRIGSHPKFIRDTYDIRSREEAPLSILIKGGVIPVETLEGTLKLKIPAHTESGKIFSLANKGFDKLTGRGKGDHLVTVHAFVPQSLNAEQRDTLDAFERSMKKTAGKKNGW